ncbi:type II toxin-antitoxin system TacA family antitoxin [Agrilutibacter solisilvae]|uniref:DUF1778 domain-containing protein n=1 Tax=Agrilutibacter solisilvae TaxID=2763317 RepID=A0A974Y188_9GAMM|nr:DUF1778 domain-containing protein [Lysobacter solisilvae]QSX78710.1 DUF1778 domain-containing protein [Lysobacter solisilvae]
MHANSTDRGRITARVTAYAQQLIEQAAQMTATTTNQFVAQAALREAERVIEEHSTIHLSIRDAQRFLDAIDNPQPIPDRLAASLRNHLEARQHDTGSRPSSIRWNPKPR